MWDMHRQMIGMMCGSIQDMLCLQLCPFAPVLVSHRKTVTWDEAAMRDLFAS